MIAHESFEEQMALLKKACEHGSYEYTDASKSFRRSTTSHFSGVARPGRHGVYIVRQRDTGEVLYVGKAGTIDSRGQFKDQDIPGRLKNVKGNVPANKWFGDLVQQKGPLLIEYVFLSIRKSPAFVEATLLQAYLNEHHRLPYKNKSL